MNKKNFEKLKNKNFNILFFDNISFCYIDKSEMKIIVVHKNYKIEFPLNNSEFIYKDGNKYFYLVFIVNNKLIIKKIYFNLKIEIKIFKLSDNNYENYNIYNLYISCQNEIIVFVYPLNQYFIIKENKLIIKNRIFKSLINNKEYNFKYIDLYNENYIIENNDGKSICSNVIYNKYDVVNIHKNKVLGIKKGNDYFYVHIYKDGILYNKIKYHGKYITNIQYDNNLYILFIRNNKSNCIFIDLKKFTIKYIIKNNLSKIRLVYCNSNELIIESDSLKYGLKIIKFGKKRITQKYIFRNFYKKSIYIDDFYFSDLKYTSITNSKKEDILLVSFHGGPESVELLYNNYERLFYKLLNLYNIKIIIFNYPGSISYDDSYRRLPHKNWKSIINKSFNKLMKLEYNDSKIIFLGGSFGGTVELLIDNELVENKIIINPLLDLNNHIKNIPSSYLSWFNKRFGNTDFLDISIEKLFESNIKNNLYFILGENDEVINNKNILNLQKKYNSFMYFWDKGKHNSNYLSRYLIILNIIKDLQKGEKNEKNYRNR